MFERFIRLVTTQSATTRQMRASGPRSQIIPTQWWLVAKAIPISNSTIKLMTGERDRTHFSHDKSARELGCYLHPV